MRHKPKEYNRFQMIFYLAFGEILTLMLIGRY